MRDLGEIARYIPGIIRPPAERVGLELVRLAESLAVLPRRGGQLRARPGVRRVVSDPYLVIYRIDETQRVVYMQRFWHAKRDPQSGLPG